MAAKKGPPLTDKEVIEKARWLWEEGIVRTTHHCKVELKNASATLEDVRNVLFGGCKVVKSEYDRSHRTWKYCLEGPDVEGELLSIVLCIDLKNSKLVLVTAF